MADEKTETKKQKKKEFKPQHRVIVPTLVRFSIPIPGNIKGEERVEYAKKRITKIVEKLHKDKGVHASAEFPPPEGHIR
jgi:phosphoribosyl-dephospho-CoA transferase